MVSGYDIDAGGRFQGLVKSAAHRMVRSADDLRPMTSEDDIDMHL